MKASFVMAAVAMASISTPSLARAGVYDLMEAGVLDVGTVITADAPSGSYGGQPVYRVTGISGSFGGEAINGLSSFQNATNTVLISPYFAGGVQSLSFVTSNGSQWNIGPSIAGQNDVYGITQPGSLAMGFITEFTVTPSASPGLSLPLPGGTVSAPVFISGGPEYSESGPGSFSPISQLEAKLGIGTTNNYYEFYWRGGDFQSEATVIPDSAILATNDEFAFNLYNASDVLVASQALSSFHAGIVEEPLAAGEYTIGVTGYSPVDPMLYIAFDTPIGGAPEPASWAMLVLGFGLVGATLRRQRERATI